MNKSKRFLIILILTLFPSACNAGKTTPTIDPGVSLTAAAITDSAATAVAASSQFWLTSSAKPQISPTPALTGTPVPSATRAVIVNTPTCENAAYVSDVTIPDGTLVAPGKSFTKTWSVKNTGTCDWTTSFALVFLSGDAMSGSRTSLSGTVNPGEKLDVSLALIAPMTAGKYTGYWRLQNAAGTFFGDSVYVQIVVSAGTVTGTVTITPTRTTTSIPVDTSTPTAVPTDTTIPDTPTETPTS